MISIGAVRESAFFPSSILDLKLILDNDVKSGKYPARNNSFNRTAIFVCRTVINCSSLSIVCLVSPGASPRRIVFNSFSYSSLVGALLMILLTIAWN